MKINLVLLESNQSYIKRIVSVFTTKYADKFTLHAFSDPNKALEVLKTTRIDVFLADEAFEIDPSMIPSRCGFAYFVNSAGFNTRYDQPAICKFQRAELIYKQILSLYSENAGHISGLKLHDDSTKIFIFSSPCGGTGTSTVAAGCARHFAQKGKKTLYLNLEKFGSAGILFSSDGQFDLSDIIMVLKNKKKKSTNLSLKLESCVKKDASNVYFFESPKSAMDVLELDAPDLIDLISELKLLGSYEYVVIDIDFSLDDKMLEFYKLATSVVMVSDGSKSANAKLFRAYHAILIKDQNADIPLQSKLVLIYNKFSSKVCEIIQNIDIRNIGGFQPYMGVTAMEISRTLSANELYDKL